MKDDSTTRRRAQRRATHSRGSHATPPSHGGPLLVLGIVLAVFTLWIVPGLSSSSHGAHSPDAREVISDDAVRGEADDSHDPDSPPDAAGAAYRAVRAGDCLAVRAGEPEAARPDRVACESAEAFHRVLNVVRRTQSCPSGPGLSYWYYISAADEMIALCLERTFRVGDCFAAASAPGVQGIRGHQINDAHLRSPLACDAAARELPEPYDTVMVITEVRSAPLRGDRDSPSCAPPRGSTEEQWYWIVNRGTVMVCATTTAPRLPSSAAAG